MKFSHFIIISVFGAIATCMVKPIDATAKLEPRSNLKSRFSETSGKRGLAYNNNNPDKNAEYANHFVGYNSITWGYDWGFPSFGLDSSFELYVGLERRHLLATKGSAVSYRNEPILIFLNFSVPMLWGLPSGSDPSWTAAVQTSGTKNILGFNEPDLTYSGSSDISPANAAAGYKTYIEPFANTVRIGMPNVLVSMTELFVSSPCILSRVLRSHHRLCSVNRLLNQ